MILSTRRTCSLIFQPRLKRSIELLIAAIYIAALEARQSRSQPRILPLLSDERVSPNVPLSIGNERIPIFSKESVALFTEGIRLSSMSLRFFSILDSVGKQFAGQFSTSVKLTLRATGSCLILFMRPLWKT